MPVRPVWVTLLYMFTTAGVKCRFAVVIWVALLYIFTTAGVKCRVAVANCSPYFIIVVYIIFSGLVESLKTESKGAYDVCTTSH